MDIRKFFTRLMKSLHIALFVQGPFILSLSDQMKLFSLLKCQNFYIDLSNDYGEFRVEIKQRLSKFEKWPTSL